VPKHERSTGGAAFYQVYETRDRRHIVLAGQEPKFIRNLLGALKRDDLIPLCLRGPGPHQQPVIAFLAETFGRMSAAEAEKLMGETGAGFTPAAKSTPPPPPAPPPTSAAPATTEPAPAQGE